ncbi:hypothetical protein CEXT_378391 [Caerostris extrusa]|uniref:Uncharacterized protein n=1 Tax=Caerostris extrusa TaxID=172846 RepID=A0AAV4WUR7_CAEEX|nr:hypothetical protein CEXT_378391 [Caerostris extrusa]
MRTAYKIAVQSSQKAMTTCHQHTTKKIPVPFKKTSRKIYFITTRHLLQGTHLRSSKCLNLSKGFLGVNIQETLAYFFDIPDGPIDVIRNSLRDLTFTVQQYLPSLPRNIHSCSILW